MNLEKQVDKRKVFAGLLIGAGAVLIYCLLTNLDAVNAFFHKVMGYLMPVTWGLLLAYLMRPMVKRFERLIPKFIKSPKARLHISSIGTLIIVVILIIVFIYMVLPQLIDSIMSFVKNIDPYLASVRSLIEEYSDKLGIEDSESILVNITSSNVFGSIKDWLTDNLNRIIGTLMNYGSGIMNFVISLMIALYALLDRRNLKQSLLRIETAVIGKQRSVRVNEIIVRGDGLMIKFLTSNLLDAFIIGIVNFIYLGIVGAPYQTLLAIMLGVTNFIPTFGPIIGGVILCFILLLAKPSIVIITIIFTLILQQIDGNVIKPLLFGDSTGLSPFWVLVAIVVGGRAFGIIGMIVGVPVVALLRSVIKELLDKRIAVIEKAEKLEKAEATDGE